MKKSLSALLAMLLFGMNFCAVGAVAETENYDNVLTYDVTATDVAPISGKIVVYPNESSAPRTLASDEYKLSNEGVSQDQIKDNTCFRQAFLLVFDSNGRLVEAGANLLANVGGRTNSPQLSVTVPAGGFMVGFDGITPQPLRKAYDTAMEGAMLYNATMSIRYEIFGEYDKTNKKITVKYDNPKAPSENAIKFLFVGNSSTYFSGTPIKFKGLALAAGVEADVDYSTFGSAYLHEFANANHERGKFFRSKLNAKKYDYVVLQDAAGASRQDSLDSLEVIIPLIKANGATPLFYMRYSSTGDFYERRDTAYKYHKNYTLFGKTYNAKVSPVADAFITSLENSPEIDLLADDRSHHSAAGAYLAACCWLYDYLGVDPRGNTFLANLPEETAEKLQEYAYKTCTEGYKYPDDPGSFAIIDGTEYANIALGCSYVSDGTPYTSDSNECYDVDKVTGKTLGKYTDGIFATAGNDASIGGYKGTEVSITVDLGTVSEIKRVLSDIFGNNWGIPTVDGAKATIQFSDDGEEFTDKAEAEMGAITTSSGFERRDILFNAPAGTKARYVKVNYKLNPVPGKYYCLWSSEICVYGTEGKEDDPADEYMPGDVNGNNKIDTSDYAMCKRAFLRTYELSAEQLKRADINKNGEVDASEYAMIKRHYLGTYTIPGTAGN